MTQFELLTAAAFWQMAERGRRGGGRRGRARRALRRDQRDRLAGDGADERRPRAHPLAGPDAHGHRRGEARGRASRSARSCSARSWPRRRWPWPSAWRASATRRIVRAAADAADAPSAARARRLSAAQLRARAGGGRGVSGGRRGSQLREQARRAAAAAAHRCPGACSCSTSDPPTVLDGAHNPHAVAALVESLPEVLEPAPRPLALVLGVLEDKDAAAMLAALLPLCERAWFTAPPSSRALSPAALQSLARQLGFEASACEPQPARALAQARRWALRARGRGAGHGLGVPGRRAARRAIGDGERMAPRQSLRYAGRTRERPASFGR